MRLVLVHGFTQTGRSWAPIIERLPPETQPVTPDLPGHGTRHDVDADLWTTADLLALECGRGTWVGYSMGGRACLHVALRHPEVVQRLVLVSTTAGIDDPAERRRRRDADDALAERIERQPIADVIDAWLAQPMWATLPADRAGRATRLENDPKGLASSLRRAGTGAQDDLWPRLGEITAPVAVVTGELDAKFTALGRRLAEHTHASHTIVPGAGHAVPWERPDAFAATLTR